MATQTLTIGKRRFVVVPEREFLRLQKRAQAAEVKPSFAEEAMESLRTYRKRGKAARWSAVKQRLGL